MADPISVNSAAVIGGDLIIGLSDGSMINAGRVQGPQGLTGPAGQVGEPGQGVDGNTVLAVQGTPGPTDGRDGDFAINTKNWTIYGPKSAGGWGIGTALRGDQRSNPVTSTDAVTESERRSRELFGTAPYTDRSSGRTYNTGDLPNSGQKSVGAGNITPAGSGFTYQQDINNWVYSAFNALDSAIPVDVVGELPAAGGYDGDLVLFNDKLYVWSIDTWIQVGSGVLTITAGNGIEVTSVPGESQISAKLGSGLQFDINGAIEATGGALQFRGGVDLSDDSEIPAIKQNGDTYANTYDGAISAGWQAVIKEPPATAQVNDLIIWDADDSIFTYVARGGPGVTDPRLPYRLGTDKAVRSIDVAATDPSIELVDAEDNFSNVRFRGKGGITTSSDAGAININGGNLLQDGMTTNKLMINRTAGGSIDSMKVTNITGGATVWRLDAKAGSDGPIIYKTEGLGFHKFVGSVFLERVGDTKGGFTIEGRKADGDIGNLLQAYHNSGSTPDAINYTGKIDSNNNIVNKAYVDSAASAAISFSSSYDSNFFCKSGFSGTEVGDGEVMFLNSGEASVTRMTPSDVVWIALNEDQFDWAKCSFAGIIRVSNGANFAGNFHVYDFKDVPGRSKNLKVKPIEVDDAQKLEADSGTPMKFRGMFLS